MKAASTQQISARKGPMGNAAGLTPWLDKCPSRNCIKAAHSFFGRLIQRASRLTTWVNKILVKAESKAFATTSVGVSDMTNTREVSNLQPTEVAA